MWIINCLIFACLKFWHILLFVEQDVADFCPWTVILILHHVLTSTVSAEKSVIRIFNFLCVLYFQTIVHSGCINLHSSITRQSSPFSMPLLAFVMCVASHASTMQLYLSSMCICSILISEAVWPRKSLVELCIFQYLGIM